MKKHFGEEMSSRFMPPKVGAIAFTNEIISSELWTFIQRGKASTFANSLNRTAFPSITGSPASGPISPSPSTAVPSETTAT